MDEGPLLASPALADKWAAAHARRWQLLAFAVFNSSCFSGTLIGWAGITDALQSDDSPRTPCIALPKGTTTEHQEKNTNPIFPFPACVARPAGKAEIARESKARAGAPKGVGPALGPRGLGCRPQGCARMA